MTSHHYCGHCNPLNRYSCKPMHGEIVCDDCFAENAQLKARIEVLERQRDGLAKYAHHWSACDSAFDTQRTTLCSCGLDRIEQEIAQEKDTSDCPTPNPACATRATNPVTSTQ